MRGAAGAAGLASYGTVPASETLELDSPRRSDDGALRWRAVGALLVVCVVGVASMHAGSAA